MAKKNIKIIAKRILALADVKINGKRPWDIAVRDDRFYNRVLLDGSLGLGESYMEGWWTCKSLDQLFDRLLRARLDTKIKPNLSLIFKILKTKIFNMQSKLRAFQVGKVHYDLGNDLYSAMLDKRKVYTCAYWRNAKNLDEAQKAKLDLVCKKLSLKPGQKILDIGCGWGSFMKFAAQKYKVKVVGITVSKKQVELGKKLCKGLPVEFRLQDYRDLNEKFDHIVSLGMFEHVGPKNYKKYMKVVDRCLKKNGLFLLHTIGTHRKNNRSDPWIEKYIFPNGFIPNISQIVKMTRSSFIIEDWHNFGADYDSTLMAWFKNFNSNWKFLRNSYSNKFYLMWKYYLLCCAGSFRARHNQLWQIVFSKNGVPRGYVSIR